MKHRKITIVAFLLACFVFLSFRLTTGGKEKLIQISKEYKKYQQHRDVQLVVTDSSKYKWTITLCDRPKDDPDMGWHPKIDSTFISKANASLSPHGNKLYKLYIKEYGDYIQNAPTGQPAGQVIVKETWNVKEIIYDSLNKTIDRVQSKNDGKWYTPTTVSELFIMYKENEGPGNDKGWVYGVVNVENPKERPVVLNNIRNSTCINCHAGTKYDRIFGPSQNSQKD
ncbi:MAG TPA: cytochrome P460 family protein [Chitinophagaceae bacterium]|jgi:hypothetical protein|nr:cytochrome P460 family protein [Chitinophagaceae bacterium]